MMKVLAGGVLLSVLPGLWAMGTGMQGQGRAKLVLVPGGGTLGSVQAHEDYDDEEEIDDDEIAEAPVEDLAMVQARLDSIAHGEFPHAACNKNCAYVRKWFVSPYDLSESEWPIVKKFLHKVKKTNCSYLRDLIDILILMATQQDRSTTKIFLRIGFNKRFAAEKYARLVRKQFGQRRAGIDAVFCYLWQDGKKRRPWTSVNYLTRGLGLLPKSKFLTLLRAPDQGDPDLSS